ncbi:hypothetical protein HOD83_02200, partial [Candidatus Woesearchaeota archaeon]|nr:hypothetical protein [Candidatus Woesearchaeota archaeon]
MVTLFRKMLDAKFPPFARGGERVTDYNGIERIAVNMNEVEFQGNRELFDEVDLAQLTKRIINIPFEIIPDKGGSPGIFIEFKPPEENDKYKLNFEGHVIKVFKPFSYPF